MKKITLIMSVMLIWGCSQAENQSEEKEAVKAEVKEQVTEQVENAKELATDVVDSAKESVTDDAVDVVKEQVTEQVENAKELATDVVDSAKESVTEDAVVVVKEQVKEQVKEAKYQPGIHYSVINPAYKTNKDNQVIVYEFFGYPCPHCATFEPFMKKLESDLPEHAKLVRVPVVFYPQWKPFAQAYYTFEAMGMVDEAHVAMFNAIHQQKKQFRTIDEIAVWAAGSFNVDKDKFLSTAKSFMIDGQIRKGMQMMQAMGVSSTPTLVTNGKYTPNSKTLKSRNDLLEITKYLVDMEAENMGLAK